MKKIVILYTALLLMLFDITGIKVYGLEEGSYILSNTTYYVNPDTGASDDGGDTSTGEGMCRNATYTESLYELEDGKHYVTLRINLISFISDIHFFVQQTKGDADSYYEVEYAVMGENTEENTKDFRFEMPGSDVFIKPQFFVGPMNRNVTYFVGLDMDTSKEDKGVFAAFNGTEAETEEDDDPEEPEVSEVPDVTEGTTQGSADPEPETAESSAGEQNEEVQDPSGESDSRGSNTGEDKSQEVSGLVGFTAEGDAMDVGESDNENEEEGDAADAWVIAAVLIVAAVLVLALRRKKWGK